VTSQQRAKRRIAKAYWRLANPVARSASEFVPCWVVLETTGHRSGKRRQVPLARGPVDGSTAWLISIHGLHSAYAQNIAADPRVRLKLHGRWRDGTAALTPLDDAVLSRFSWYALAGAQTLGVEPRLIQIELK
jgi:deazaflavin-dependent oxidoreductase (nitroreductase family)